MKVVVSGYVGKKVTGIGRNLNELLKSSNRHEYVLYVNEDMRDAFSELGENVEVKTYKVSKQSSIGNLLWNAFVFPWKVRKEQGDVGLIPNFTLLLFKFCPTVVIMHDLIEFNIPDKFSPLKMFYRTRLADPITAKNADRIITVSKNSEQDLMHFLDVPKGKIDVIYNGVDLNKFRKMSREESEGILTDRSWPNKFLLYAGTIDHPGKGPYQVVKAFEQLCSTGYEGSLVLAGMPGSGYELVVDAVQSSKFKDRIVMTGYIEDRELVCLFSRCDLFFFLSLYEGFGMPPLEALACGSKVLVSNRSSLPEVIGDCGVAVEPENLDTVVSEARKMLDGNGADARTVSDHLKRFDWKKLAGEFEDSLKKSIY